MLLVSRLLKGFNGSAQLPHAFKASRVAISVSGRCPPIRAFAAASASGAMHDWVDLLKDKDLFKEKCFIGGEWVDAVDGETIDVRSPA